MRKLLISAAMTALFILPLSAWAQPDHDREHGGGGPGQQQQQQGGPPAGGHGDLGGGPHPQPGPNPSFNRGPNGGNRPAMNGNPGYSRGPNGNGDFNRPAMNGNPNYSRGPNGGGDFNHPVVNGNPNYGRGPNGGDFRHGASNDFHPGGPGMAGRPGPGGDFHHGAPGSDRGGPRHDFRGFGDFHQNFDAPRRFRAGFYRRPPGWYPHRWVFGEFLPTAFWARDYWLMDYMDYALPPPPPYAVWIRYGDDALLIDQDTGEIITVEYGVFY